MRQCIYWRDSLEEKWVSIRRATELSCAKFWHRKILSFFIIIFIILFLLIPSPSVISIFAFTSSFVAVLVRLHQSPRCWQLSPGRRGVVFVDAITRPQTKAANLTNDRHWNRSSFVTRKRAVDHIFHTSYLSHWQMFSRQEMKHQRSLWSKHSEPVPNTTTAEVRKSLSFDLAFSKIPFEQHVRVYLLRDVFCWILHQIGLSWSSCLMMILSSSSSWNFRHQMRTSHQQKFEHFGSKRGRNPQIGTKDKRWFQTTCFFRWKPEKKTQERKFKCWFSREKYQLNGKTSTQLCKTRWYFGPFFLAMHTSCTKVTNPNNCLNVNKNNKERMNESDLSLLIGHAVVSKSRACWNDPKRGRTPWPLFRVFRNSSRNKLLKSVFLRHTCI